MINENTKAFELLETYPWLVDEIKKMGKEFEMIDNPITRMLFKNATIGDICKQFKLDESQVIEQITKMIENHKESNE